MWRCGQVVLWRPVEAEEEIKSRATHGDVSGLWPGGVGVMKEQVAGCTGAVERKGEIGAGGGRGGIREGV